MAFARQTLQSICVKVSVCVDEAQRGQNKINESQLFYSVLN